MSDLFNNIKPGHLVHYLTPQGQTRKGTVVMNRGTHLVLNRGKGQPQVVTPKNFVKAQDGTRVTSALLSNVAKSLKEDKALMAKHQEWMKAQDKKRSDKAWEKVHADMPGIITRLVARSKGTKLNKQGKVVEATWQGAEDPYNWDPVARAAVFKAAAEKVRAQRVKKGVPVPHKLDTGRVLKSGPAPYRRGVAEDSKDMEGAAERVAKNKKHRKKLHELDSSTLASYVSKAIADRKMAARSGEMAARIHTPERSKYFQDKAARRIAKRGAGIKKAVGKIAANLPSEPLKAHADSEGAKHGGWSGMSEAKAPYGRKAKPMKPVNWDKIQTNNYSLLKKSEGGASLKDHMLSLAVHGIPSRKSHSPYVGHTALEVPKKHARKASKILYGYAMEETDLNEVSAPGKEDWIKANKERFIAKYGKEKGLRVLYAKAWKDSKNESLSSGKEWYRLNQNVHYNKSGEVYTPSGKTRGHMLLSKGSAGYFDGDYFVSKGSKWGGIKKSHVTKVNEARENEYTANLQMAQSAKPTQKGHYLMRDGRKLSGPHSPEDAVKAYKNMSDSKGVKIVHVKETHMFEVSLKDLMIEAKVEKAAEKAISLKKKAKSNKHVDTEPKLDIQDKGTGGPMEPNHQEGENRAKL